MLQRILTSIFCCEDCGGDGEVWGEMSAITGYAHKCFKCNGKGVTEVSFKNGVLIIWNKLHLLLKKKDSYLVA